MVDRGHTLGAGVDVSDALEGMAAACVRARNACCLFGGNMRQIYRARKGINVFWRLWGQALNREMPTLQRILTCRVFRSL